MEKFGLKDTVDIEQMSLRLSALDYESILAINLLPFQFQTTIQLCLIHMISKNMPLN